MKIVHCLKLREPEIILLRKTATKMELELIPDKIFLSTLRLVEGGQFGARPFPPVPTEKNIYM